MKPIQEKRQAAEAKKKAEEAKEKALAAQKRQGKTAKADDVPENVDKETGEIKQ